jgi:mRNA interferase RelE/StbE
LPEFKIAETDNFQKKLSEKQFSRLKNKIINFIYPQLKTNPFFGPNIKKLKGSLSGIYRYRIGNYRIFYSVDSNKIIVFMLDIKHRQGSY